MGYQLISRLKKWKNPLDGGFKLCDEVTTLNTLHDKMRTALVIFFSYIGFTTCDIIFLKTL
ncbi:TPA: hypothetical protein HGR20_16360 [Escherichia coli]|nr:hypothetical protein BWI89_15265 [Escherichia coli]EBW9262407.1 hypothetical protein [Salmonella enterica subsp. enterica serovar Enteritidis]MDN0631708.1 hypothetical protein [Escherichia coli]MDN1460639.1 hypothetical protein [Escherichia coli]MDN1622037.1 hypothetical protein [Escherichia coli]